jgi:hypothetical protein
MPRAGGTNGSWKTRAEFPAVAAQSILTASGAYENVFSYFLPFQLLPAPRAMERVKRHLPRTIAKKI